MKEIILNRLNALINTLPPEEDFIVVLKGIPLSFVDDGGFPEDLEAAKLKPKRYSVNLEDSGRKFLSYEEFLLTKAYDEYDNIYILNNNLFVNLYPIEADLTDATKKTLLEYFAEPEDDPKSQTLDRGNANLAKIFASLKSHENHLIGCYNDAEIINIETLNLFAPADVQIDSSAAQNAIDLREEEDFIDLLKTFKPGKIFVRTQDDSFDDRLKILNHYFPVQILRVPPQVVIPAFKHNEDFTKILKGIWNYDEFQSFKVYDRQALYADKKNLSDVSQEEIISHIVEQVKNCRSRKNFRDVFVTAPTGAGKSLIFQLPAIYLAEKFNLLTIVISPLIALMNDQVQKFYDTKYPKVATVNSTTSPTLKKDILNKVKAGEVNLLYISPETLLSRSDIEQLIGDRELGLIVIDEAHIVTTWGKQFRPDYWYLGERIKKLRREHSFIIATFTATAIYGGQEDMYHETISTLHMRDPITYLGYIKRDDIDIEICRTQPKDKSKDLLKAAMHASIFEEKTLIYFPWVKLINKELDKLGQRKRIVATYHGRLDKDAKQMSYEKFRNDEAWVMLATKAFGMGIDINDIKIVMHYAPTGSVCDYVQEIGRAARQKDLRGKAIYHYDSGDFSYVKILNGLSKIRRGQLLDVIKKICELHVRRKGKNNLLLDAENFSYIFWNSPNEDETINKVKLALLIIQKDLEKKLGYPPISVRPFPLYAEGFFVTDSAERSWLQKNYGDCLAPIEPAKNIYSVNLKMIWEKNFQNETFPQFKRRIYKDHNPVLIATTEVKDLSRFKSILGKFQSIVEDIYKGKNSTTIEALSKRLAVGYKSKNICEVLIASMNADKSVKRNSNGISYHFTERIQNYFLRLEDKFNEIIGNTRREKFYITYDHDKFKMVLGILEAMGVLTFDIEGGLNNQLCIHINQIGVLKNVDPDKYSNKILKDMETRYELSLATLEYIYANNFNSAQIWNLLEDYFLGRKII